MIDPDMPPLENVRGNLEFTADSLGSRGVTASIIGLPMKLDLKTQPGGIVLAQASGDATAVQLRKQFAYTGLKNLSGGTHWNAVIKAQKKSTDVRISSDLVGLASTLPEPFNKSAREAMPLLFERKPADARLAGKRVAAGARQSIELSLGRALRAQLVYRDEPGPDEFERGLVTIGDVAARMPDRGLLVAIFQPRLNLDLWRSYLADAGDKAAAIKGKAAATDGDNGLTPSRIDLRTTDLQALGRSFHDVRISASRSAAIWSADINSREIAAKLDWAGGDAPKLSGRITRFGVPEAAAEPVPGDSLKSLPNLDLTVDHLTLKGHDYGELHLVAENRSGDWSSSFTVRNDDGALDGKGVWRQTAAAGAAPTSDTQVDFKLHAKSIERGLNRIGYPNTVKRGNADLNGHLAWKGAPHEFDLASLSGQLVLEAHDGQFNKLEPGVGRLLGILSLQAIPRRITLDFRDVFSEGFAFDTIKGQIAISKGVMTTSEIEINGPAAKVQMAGNVDLVKETQDLKVRVHPALSNAGAVGLLLIHPAVGATALVFNKLFGSPIDSVFAYDFAVTGAWADPQVAKIGAQPGAAAKAAGDK
jgi:uncharacterized protein (TIGR02099 family)